MTGGRRRTATAVQVAVALALVAGLLVTGGSGATLGSGPDRARVDPGAAAAPVPGSVGSGSTPGSRSDGSRSDGSRSDGSRSDGSAATPGSMAAPAAVTGGAGTPADLLAADVATGVEQFWRDQFPVHFGRPWVNIRAFHAVDPGNPAVPAPCLRRPLDLSEQALYCPDQDTVAWDRAGLVPK